MTPELIAAIQTFTLNSRKLLERETEEQLQGLYGWLPNGTFGIGTALGLPEAVETRARLERYVLEEREAGLDAAAARARLKRETAFTWLNRVVAFRLMEERKIIPSTFGKLQRANAFIYYLTDVLGEAGLPASTPINVMGEGPADAAYRQFLLWQCGQLSEAVSVLFDPATLASRFCPRPAVLKALAETMNAAGLAEAWKAGNEETIGWIYEGFIEDENAEVFAKFSKGKKVLAEEIGAATQRFTPRWIVQFLIQNSLGRIWVEMHPDSRLARSLDYLVPLEAPTPRPLKPAAEITFLDPCCGSMHFGLLAFDLFVEMYQEERENAGKPGWPSTPSAASDEAIPELVLARNLHGIDIDMRAVQVSALALLLRARTLNLKARTTDINLACANVEQLTGGRLEEFISAAQFSHPIYERVLRRLAVRLKDSDHLGSLLRIEAEIEQLIAAERRRSDDVFAQFPGLHPEQFDSQEGLEEFFSILTEQIGRHLDHFVQASRADGRDGGVFAQEAAKGLRFLRLAERRYDVVATNPPYMSGRNMSEVMAKYLSEAFESTKGDLYAAFVMRCVELADPLGLVAMLTQQSFMFITSYEGMRARLRKTVAIETMAHLGSRAFPNISGEKVNTTAFTLRREATEARRQEQVGTYFRLVKERDATAKRISFESSLASLRRGSFHPQVFHYRQDDFDAIPDKPWVYWMTTNLLSVFRGFPFMEKVAKPRQGLATADNTRFLRFWWEVGSTRIGFGLPSRGVATSSGKKWFPYMKGGTPIGWYGNQTSVLNWERDGAEIEGFKPRAVIRNPDYYFRRGVTWSDVSSKGFAARLSPGGFIHDVTGMTCFPTEEHISTILGVLNSRIARFLLSAINPTIHFQVGDIERLPIPSERIPKIDDIVNRCVELAQQKSQDLEQTWDFVRPPVDVLTSSVRKAQLADFASAIDTEVSRLYGLNDDDLTNIDRELTGAVPTDNEEEGEENSELGDSDDDESAVDLSQPAWARTWLSYALGTVLGRFDIGQPGGLGCGDFSDSTAAQIRTLIDPDGIMPCEAGHPQDLVARVFACSELMLRSRAARDAVFRATFTAGDPVEALRGWLDRFAGLPAASFWKYHHQLYRKRPVYWPFQSPRKTYTVWIFHEKLGPNTLHTIKEFADFRLNLLERSEIPPLRLASATNRAKERDLQKLLEQSDDLREFSSRLKAHIESGYQSCIDDGVLLNAAPLHDLFPSWPDAKKAWEELKAGKYDWAHQARRYWPDRVTEACRTNRSFAIAHGREDLCPAAPPRTVSSRGRQPPDLGDIV